MQKASSVSGEPQRYFFVHLMKTAGTVVTLTIGRTLGRDAICPGPAYDLGPGAEIDMAGLVQKWPEMRSTVKMVAGHFPSCMVDALDPDMAVFTVLRDPVDRVLSLLKVERGKLDATDQRNLADLYHGGFRTNPLFPNHIVRMLGTSLEEMPAGLLTPVDLTPSHVDHGIERIAAMEVVGFQDDLAAFGDALRTAFGWDLAEFGKGNVSPPAPTPDGLREAIAADNALDVALYQRARQTFGASG